MAGTNAPANNCNFLGALDPTNVLNGNKWIGIDITYQSISVVLRRVEDLFGAKSLELITIDGIPRDMQSAEALAHKIDDRLRKEFEKWAVLTYTNNRAVINEKKGGWERLR